MTAGGPDWLLVEFVRETQGVRAAVVVSADGLRQANSSGMGVAMGDQLAAAASGLISLARGTARLLGTGAVTQTILEMEGGYLFVTAIDETATLAVHTDRRCDLGVIGYEMTLLATRVGHALSPPPLAQPARPQHALAQHALAQPAAPQHAPVQPAPPQHALAQPAAPQHALAQPAPPPQAPPQHTPAPYTVSPHALDLRDLSPPALAPDPQYPAGP